jgi:hypothetical protein
MTGKEGVSKLIPWRAAAIAGDSNASRAQMLC